MEYLGEGLPPARSSYYSHVAALSSFWRLALLVASPMGSAFFLSWDGVAARKALLLHQEQKDGSILDARERETKGNDEL
jgi:hypothetical protein